MKCNTEVSNSCCSGPSFLRCHWIS